MLIPVVLCGGVGARLWPVSREAYPKPFIKLQDGESLIQKTFLRAAACPGVSEILTLTNRDYYFQSLDAYNDCTIPNPPQLEFLLEPCARNTAPAIAMAALYVADKFGPEAQLLVLPADHIIEKQAHFVAAVERASRLAAQGLLVTFGLKPERPDTGFGYIEIGAECVETGLSARDSVAIDTPISAHKVKNFAEKPDAQRAQQYVDAGTFLWNAGIFCFSAATFLAALKQCAPQVYAGATTCWENIPRNSSPLQIPAAEFATLPNISIDYAVMESAHNVSVVGCDLGWSDVGSWTALGAHTQQDAEGNSIEGQVLPFSSRNCYIRSEDRLVATLGVKDLIIVDTSDALLVAHKDCAQEVKQVVEYLKEIQHPAYRTHNTVHRPWGTYTELECDERFKIKRIMVSPGASLSLQMHYHRCEHWIVVSGTARIINGDNEILLKTNESTFIPCGEKHRLENPGKVPLVLIEVQSGEYLGEDDIVRFDDVYGRNIAEK